MTTIVNNVDKHLPLYSMLRLVSKTSRWLHNRPKEDCPEHTQDNHRKSEQKEALLRVSEEVQFILKSGCERAGLKMDYLRAADG